MNKDNKILLILLLIVYAVIGMFCLLVWKPELLDLQEKIFFNPDYVFHEPNLLWLLALLPLSSIYYFFRQQKDTANIQFSNTNWMQSLPHDPKEYLRHLPYLLTLMALSMLILALARPQSHRSWDNQNIKGIDIMFATDISVSMLARDFPENRLEAAKKVAIEFINQRPNDRMGLVIYEGASFTQVPLTTDHTVLKQMFTSLQPGMLTSGTAIGMGLASAVKRLTDSDAKSKVIILLTDGVNNAGNIQPVDAANLAKEFGIKVYTIGIGSLGEAYSPTRINLYGEYVFEKIPVEIDEKSLQQIAEITGGKYYRAKDIKSLQEVYAEIDNMEKSIIKVTEHRKKSEEYYYFALGSILLLLLGFAIRHFYIRQTP